MKKSTLALFLFFVLITPLLAQKEFSGLDFYGGYDRTGLSTGMSIASYKELSKKLKLTYYGYYYGTNKYDFAELYTGLAYSPTKWFTIGLSAGVQNQPDWYRFASQLWLGTNTTSFFLLLEKGSDRNDYLYKSTLSYNFSKRLSAGIAAWRFHGVGPLLRYDIKILNADVFVLPAYDFDDKSPKIFLGFNLGISD